MAIHFQLLHLMAIVEAMRLLMGKGWRGEKLMHGVDMTFASSVNYKSAREANQVPREALTRNSMRTKRQTVGWGKKRREREKIGRYGS